MRRAIGVLVLAAFIFSTAPVVHGATVTESQKQLENVNGSIDSNKDKLDEIKESSKETQEQLKALDSEASALAGKLAATNDQLTAVNAELGAVQSELSQSEKKLEEQNEMFESRVVALYTTGNVSYMEVLFGASSFSDMVSRLEWVTAIMEYDKNLISEMKAEKQKIETKRAELESKKKSAEVLKAEAGTKYGELEQKAAEKQKLMSSLEKDKSYYEMLIAAEEKEAANIKARIQALQSQNSGSGTGGNSSSSSGTSSITGGKSFSITSPYGWRIHPITGVSKFHKGIDIAAPSGTAIYSLKSGTVMYTGYDANGYGYYVMVDHGDIISLYAHNSSIVVTAGQQVKSGQLICYSGNTGGSTGPHLHFEVRLAGSGETINPESYYIR
ncbi:MAG: peptidase [Firmicutes bacterium]|nr:peptidase [Bacillota bacterium]